MLKALILLACLSSPALAVAQTAQIEMGGMRQDTSAPVSVDADQLSVDQASGQATFTGNVRVSQGELRLAADTVQVEYGADEGEIRALQASGNVTLANESIAAEAQEASYTIASGLIEMTGDVLLTQGQSTIAGQRLVIDAAAGTGRMEGRVRTTFRPGASQ
ncbi:lipopolysaccharide transport periplasmic protein LptA [Falsirhodobacter deserti]|uniref:lipopolysaccharide transport periplasmic protein LptA n=1 Tax=Falsirhodobacter deserti TaxID=1365611 RepID=UPI000FE371A9|nr:lipopolysaccharide transport periplasmic protein LptA [Falsirhodobacter deserti]